MRQVKPSEAKKGTFLKSFDMGDFGMMLDYCADTQKAMMRNEIKGEVVYTKITPGRKFNDTWQVFLLKK